MHMHIQTGFTSFGRLATIRSRRQQCIDPAIYTLPMIIYEQSSIQRVSYWKCLFYAQASVFLPYHGAASLSANANQESGPPPHCHPDVLWSILVFYGRVHVDWNRSILATQAVQLGLNAFRRLGQAGAIFGGSTCNHTIVFKAFMTLPAKQKLVLLATKLRCWLICRRWAFLETRVNTQEDGDSICSRTLPSSDLLVGVFGRVVPPYAAISEGSFDAFHLDLVEEFRSCISCTSRIQNGNVGSVY